MIFLLCFALIFAAPVLHIILGILRINKRIRLSLAAIGFICVVTGIIFPVLATYIDIVNLPKGVMCATPSIGFVFLGFGVTAIAIPVIALILFITDYYRNKKAIIA